MCICLNILLYLFGNIRQKSIDKLFSELEYWPLKSNVFSEMGYNFYSFHVLGRKKIGFGYVVGCYFSKKTVVIQESYISANWKEVTEELKGKLENLGFDLEFQDTREIILYR